MDRPGNNSGRRDESPAAGQHGLMEHDPILDANRRIVGDSIRSMEWPGQFFPFQIDGIAAIVTQRVLLLADDMGLGKTVQMIAALRIMLERRMIANALIIVPSGLVRQWQRELRLWAPGHRVSTVNGPPMERVWQWRVPASLFLTGYETFRQDFSGNRRTVMSNREWDVVVLDEAQKIKNRDTDISFRCMQIYRQRAYALTGTPLENHIDELHTILNFLAPLTPPTSANAAAQPPRITAVHERVQLRRKKQDVLKQLPPKSTHDVFLELTTRQKRSYVTAEKDGLMRLRNQTVIPITHILALIMRLKQICNACPETGHSAKFRDLEDRVGQLTANGHRAIIFSQFCDDHFGCHAIAKVLKKYNPLVYTGACSASAKDEIVRRFKTMHEHGVLILSLRAGGLGLNLQDADYVFHVDRWWNPAVENQAEDRSHRMGQTMPVHVYRYLIADSIEERINDILCEKRELFRSIVDDVSLDMRKVFNRKELLKLIGLEEHGRSILYASSP